MRTLGKDIDRSKIDSQTGSKGPPFSSTGPLSWVGLFLPASGLHRSCLDLLGPAVCLPSFWGTRWHMGQKPVPPVNIPIPTNRLKWVVHLPQNGTIVFDPEPDFKRGTPSKQQATREATHWRSGSHQPKPPGKVVGLESSLGTMTPIFWASQPPFPLSFKHSQLG